MATMTGLSIEQVEALVVALGDLGIDAEVLENYSGRGMYGARVTAITTDSGRDMALAAIAYVAGLVGLDFDDVPVRSDNMGYGSVIY